MFYTVKEIADLVGVSKPTIQKIINENFIEADKIEKNKFRYYSYEKTCFIIRVLKPDFDFSLLPKNTENQLKSTEKPPIKPQNPSEDIEKPQNNETLERMITIIEQQLNEKNKLLAQKDRELQELREQAERERFDLQDKLEKAYTQIAEMAQKAQYITAADKTAQIMDKQSKEEEIEPEGSGSPAARNRDKPRKGLLSKFFKF